MWSKVSGHLWGGLQRPIWLSPTERPLRRFSRVFRRPVTKVNVTSFQTEQTRNYESALALESSSVLDNVPLTLEACARQQESGKPAARCQSDLRVQEVVQEVILKSHW